MHPAHRAVISENGAVRLTLTDVPRALREAMGNVSELTARFELPVKDGQVYLSRTHPVVEGLASYMMDTALDTVEPGVARRCGVIRTSAVERRTTVLLLRCRYHIMTHRGDTTQPLLAEDCVVRAFAGAPQNAQWLAPEQAESLLRIRPEANVLQDQAAHFLRTVIDGFPALWSHIEDIARQHGEEILAAHRRVRQATRTRNVRYTVEPHLPADVLGVYVYLPKA